MIEIRLALWSDVVRLKEIWKLCFGDPDQFIDFYFSQRFKPEQTAVYLQNGVITAMLTMIPVQWVDGDDRKSNGAMLYAIATHPDFQHQGIATELMSWALTYLRDRQVELCVLVPAEAHLFNFYAKQGYQEGFTLREVVLSREEVRALPEEIGENRLGHDLKCQILSATPQEYNEIRNQLLQGTAYIAYGEEEISYQKKVSQLSGADIYLFDIDGVQGCAALERLSKDKVLLKELLLPESLIPQGLKALAEFVDAQEFIIRTPDHGGKSLGGQSRFFGMLKRTSTCTEEIQQTSERALEKAGYLGLAFD